MLLGEVAPVQHGPAAATPRKRPGEERKHEQADHGRRAPQFWKATQPTMPEVDREEEAQPATAPMPDLTAPPTSTFPIGRSL